jgi:predicted ATPase
MLTRLRIRGFKNLVDVDVRFGAFTCIAGSNGVGKSNLFDAIRFLSDLADHSLIKAATSVRDETSDVRSIFRKYTNKETVEVSYLDEMSFEAEMIIPQEGVDDLGQEAKAAATFLQYSLKLAYRKDNGFSSLSGLEIVHEELKRVRHSKIDEVLPFPHSTKWRKSVIEGGKSEPFIETEGKGGNRIIVLHQMSNQIHKSDRRRPIRRKAEVLPQTVLSTIRSTENPTVVLARNEMRSWRLLQLEPSSLRKPDNFNVLNAPIRIGEDGSHLPATLYNLKQLEKNGASTSKKNKIADVYGMVATKLSQLIEDVYSVEIDRDDQRQLLTLQVKDRNQIPYPARDLSDGTLRFLALTVIELDPTTQGVMCLEEPENGIHPARIPAMLELLEGIAVDVNSESGEDNPLRQVIVNTHSPAVVQQVSDESLLVAELREKEVRFGCLKDTWRATLSDVPTVSKGKLLAYLNPVGETNINRHDLLTEIKSDIEKGKVKKRRVIDREDLKQFLLFPQEELERSNG